MTPAEHYAEAESALAEVMDGIVMMREDGASVDVSIPLALAQVHATLATVDPVKMADTAGVGFYSQHGQCTCPQLPGAPFARTSTDPDCPVHGAGPDLPGCV